LTTYWNPLLKYGNLKLFLFSLIYLFIGQNNIFSGPINAAFHAKKFTVSLLHFYELVITIELEDWTPILTRLHCIFIMGVLVRVN
jgi:hypothetical protein